MPTRVLLDGGVDAICVETRVIIPHSIPSVSDMRKNFTATPGSDPSRLPPSSRGRRVVANDPELAFYDVSIAASPAYLL